MHMYIYIVCIYSHESIIIYASYLHVYTLSYICTYVRTWHIHTIRKLHTYVCSYMSASCNMDMSGLSDMYDMICIPEAQGLDGYISGKPQVHMLQLLCTMAPPIGKW